MIQFILLCLGIGLIPAGIALVWAGRTHQARLRVAELVLWSGGFALLVGLLLIMIVVFWH